MKNSISKQLKKIAVVVAASAFPVLSIHAQETQPEVGANESRETVGEGIGLMPYQKMPVDVGAKERNPFANRNPEKKEEVAEDENKEEDRIRLLISELPIGGISRGRNGGLHVLLGDMKLERGVVVPQVLPDQSAQLMVALITEEKIEFAWLEESGKGTGRRLVLPVDIEPKVGFVLNGQQSKAAEERTMGLQKFPTHHRRDPGILSDSIGSLEPQFAPK